MRSLHFSDVPIDLPGWQCVSFDIVPLSHDKNEEVAVTSMCGPDTKSKVCEYE